MDNLLFERERYNFDLRHKVVTRLHSYQEQNLLRLLTVTNNFVPTLLHFYRELGKHLRLEAPGDIERSCLVACETISVVHETHKRHVYLSWRSSGSKNQVSLSLVTALRFSYLRLRFFLYVTLMPATNKDTSSSAANLGIQIYTTRTQCVIRLEEPSDSPALITAVWF